MCLWVKGKGLCGVLINMGKNKKYHFTQKDVEFKTPLIDYNVESYDGRVDRLNDVINERGSLSGTQLAVYTDYLLESKDIESERKIKDSFFLNRKMNKHAYKEFSNIYTSKEQPTVDYFIKRNYLHEASVKENTQLRLEECLKDFFYFSLSKRRAILSEILAIDIHGYGSDFLDVVIEFFDSISVNIKDDIDYRIIKLITQGVKSSEIASELGLSIRTVDRRIEKVIRKIDGL